MTVNHNGVNAIRDGKAVWEPPAIDPLRDAVRRALEAMDDLIANITDPGVEALGARHELQTALIAAPADRGAEVEELRAELAKLIRWHREDGDALTEMRGTIERLRERHKASLRRADEINNELMEEVQRYAAGTERPVLWSVYNRMHLRALEAEAEVNRLRRMADEAQQPETQAVGWHLTPQTLDHFVRALVNEVDYDIHKGYECGEEDGEDHYPELVAAAAEILDAITKPRPFIPPAHYRRDDGVDCCVHTIPVGPDSCPACRELHDDEQPTTP